LEKQQLDVVRNDKIIAGVMGAARLGSWILLALDFQRRPKKTSGGIASPKWSDAYNCGSVWLTRNRLSLYTIASAIARITMEDGGAPLT